VKLSTLRLLSRKQRTCPTVFNRVFVRGILRGSLKSMNFKFRIIVVGVKIIKERRLSLAKMAGSRVKREVHLCKHCLVALFADAEE
jgi:hypothetical protein